MKRFLQSTLVTLGLLLTAGLVQVQAQTPSACGCAFVKGVQPKNVRVQFAGETKSVPATADMVVHRGDAIKVTHPVTASMVCDNVAGTVVLQSVPRTQPVKCSNKPKEGILIGRNGRLIDSRTMNDATVAFPIILSPRSTKLLDPLPVLRWTTISNASSYKVTVRWDNGSWTTTVPGKSSATQELAYPVPCQPNQTLNCAPPLKAGESYKLIVEANGRNSEEEGLPNLGFTLLTGPEAKRVRQKIDTIYRLRLSDALKRNMLAAFFANNELNADAIGALEGKPEIQHSPAALRLLGDLYFKLNLPHRAEAAYLSSQNLAAQDTRAGRAVTQHSLGEIYETIGNTQEAIKHYEEAAKLYRDVHDKHSRELVVSRLAYLQKS